MLLAITCFGLVKTTKPNNIAKVKYTIVAAQTYIELWLLIANLNSAKAATVKCKQFPIPSGLAYIPPINTVLAIQFIIENLRYNAPVIRTNKVGSSLAVPPMLFKISVGRKDAISPINPVTIALDIIKYFVFIQIGFLGAAKLMISLYNYRQRFA